MLHAAPFMAHPIPLLVPIFTWWEVPYIWAGAKVYDAIAGARRAVPASYLIGAEEALKRFPGLKKDALKAAIVYYDGMHNDTRMNVLLSLTAMREGAAAANYVAVKSIPATAPQAPSSAFSLGPLATTSPGGASASLRSVVVTDVLTGKDFTIKAKGIINATGKCKRSMFLVLSIYSTSARL